MSSTGQCPREDLPRQRGLRDQAEDEVRPFAEEVRPPAAHLSILKPHVEGEDVEEDEERDEDRVDEGRRLRRAARRPEIDPDGQPRRDADDAAEPERPQRTSWPLVSFLDGTEQD